MPVNKSSQSRSVDCAARIRSLIEGEDIGEARALVLEALEAHPHDCELLSLRSVLEPPHAAPREITDADRTLEFAWIMANHEAYRGRWVAIQGGELVADASSFAELQGRIRDLEGVPLIHRIP